MRIKTFDTPGGPTHVLALDSGEEVVAALLDFARDKGITGGSLTALGAFSDVVLGFFDFERKDYRRNRIDEQVEVAAMVGDFAMAGDRVKLHAHLVIAKRDGSAWGGHLLEGHVHPTLEVTLGEAPKTLRRHSDPETGLALLTP